MSKVVLSETQRVGTYLCSGFRRFRLQRHDQRVAAENGKHLGLFALMAFHERVALADRKPKVRREETELVHVFGVGDELLQRICPGGVALVQVKVFHEVVGAVSPKLLHHRGRSSGDAKERFYQIVESSLADGRFFWLGVQRIRSLCRGFERRRRSHLEGGIHFARRRENGVGVVQSLLRVASSQGPSSTQGLYFAHVVD